MVAINLIKNRYFQAGALALAMMFILGASASAYNTCISGIPNYCVVNVYDRPVNYAATDDIESTASVACKGTTRVAVVHTLQKKNTLGRWIDVHTKSAYGRTSAVANIDFDTTNNKKTTWRTKTRIVGNYGQWHWDHFSGSSTFYLGT